MAAILQITDGIDGPVLLDLNHRDTSGIGLVLGERSRIDLAGLSIADRDDDHPVVWSRMVGQSDLTARKITIPLLAVGSDPSAVPVMLSRLHQAVRRPWWLKVLRHGATVPVWLRCHPTVPSAVAEPTARSAALAKVTIETVTDPYAYGQRVDSPAVLVTQDPVSSSAFIADINDVRGDSPTPLVVSTDDRALLGSASAVMITARRRGDPAALGAGLFRQAEDTTSTYWASGSPAATMTQLSGESEFSGGSGFSWQIASPGSLQRWTFRPVLSGPDAPGVYRVLARVRRSGFALNGEVNFRVVSGDRTKDMVWGAQGPNLRVLDLGLVAVPAGQPGWHASPASLASATAGDIAVYWDRKQSLGRLDLDWVGIVPSDEGCAVLWTPGAAAPAGSWVSVDGFDHAPRVFDRFPFAAGASAVPVAPEVVPQATGALPMLGPGSNRLWLVGGMSSVPGATWDITQTISVVVSHWPRWSWLT